MRTGDDEDRSPMDDHDQGVSGDGRGSHHHGWHDYVHPHEHETLPVDPDVSADDPGLHLRIWYTLHDRSDVLAFIALGGAVGSLGRYALGVALPHGPDEIAWSTMIANLVGAFALGVVMVLVIDVLPPTRYVRPFFGVGVLGGFTTFSTYMLDTRSLLAEGEALRAFAYVFLTLAVGLAAVLGGIVVTRAATGRPQWGSAGPDEDEEVAA